MPKKIVLPKETLEKCFKLRTEEHLSYEEIAKIIGVEYRVVIRRLEEAYGKDVMSKTSNNYKYDEYYFYDINTAEKAYWLGFIVADGYLNEERNFLKIKLGWTDKEHLEKFKKAINGDMPVKTEYHQITGNPLASITVSGKIFTDGLRKHGIDNNKSQHEKPPTNVPDEFIRDFIRGYFDGDGHITFKRMKIVSSYEMCKWIQDVLIDKVGITKQIISFDSNIYHFYIQKNRYNAIDWLYYYGCSNIALDRKYKTAMRYKLYYINKCRLKKKSQNS